MHPKVFVKLKKNPKNPLVRAKKPQKTPKTQKTQKNPLGWFFFCLTRVFSNPAENPPRCHVPLRPRPELAV
jgi:hypothetical protein